MGNDPKDKHPLQNPKHRLNATRAALGSDAGDAGHIKQDQPRMKDGQWTGDWKPGMGGKR